MSAKIVQVDGFTVIGIEARTNNAKEMTNQGNISKQWEIFSKEKLLSKIPSKIDSNIIVVYTDYESDKNGDYTFLIGSKVELTASIPSGMVAKKIPAGRYAIFTSAKGPVWKVVPGIWRAIWALPKSEPGGDRAYLADYEVYDQRSQNLENAQVDIFLSVK